MTYDLFVLFILFYTRDTVVLGSWVFRVETAREVDESRTNSERNVCVLSFGLFVELLWTVTNNSIKDI